MGKIKDLTGQVFGELTVIKYGGKDKYGHSLWMCQCSCGNFKSILAGSLLNKGVKSCGCLNKRGLKKTTAKNITGQKFGRLTALKPVGSDKHKKKLWLCLCECGNYTIVGAHNLLSAGTRSCGCLKHDVTSEKTKERNKENKVHGLATTRIYSIWKGMMRRCFNQADNQYRHYGARGITVCEEWRNVRAFKEWADTHGYTDELTIERIDVNKNYCPENCTWIPLKEQPKNRRPVSEWSSDKYTPQVHEKYYLRNFMKIDLDK